MNRRTMRALVVVALVAASLLLVSGLLDRDAGWPRDLADLEGTWILDEVRGTFDVGPPETLTFRAGSGPGFVEVSDGQRTAEFEIQGIGRLEFAAGQCFEPLLPAGASEVYTMTHIRPRLPAWDHFTVFPDGLPNGPDASRRSITYERD